MENATRTAEHLARLEQRQRVLRGELEKFLTPRASLVLEVGCGHGHFLTAYAQAHPGELCVGIDVETKRVERALRKQDRAGLANLHFLQAEAHLFLETLAPCIRFSSIYVLFPDPWPKLRHHKHRLMQAPFLEKIARRTEKGARLYFRTDFLPYFAEVEAALSNNPDWSSSSEPWPFEILTVFQARAEKFNSLVAIREESRI